MAPSEASVERLGRIAEGLIWVDRGVTLWIEGVKSGGGESEAVREKPGTPAANEARSSCVGEVDVEAAGVRAGDTEATTAGLFKCVASLSMRRSDAVERLIKDRDAC